MNSILNKQTQFIDLGLTDYQKAWDYQTDLFNKILAVKSENRNLPDNQQQLTNNYLLFCEHPHVFTIGKSGDEKNLVIFGLLHCIHPFHKCTIVLFLSNA